MGFLAACSKCKQTDSTVQVGNLENKKHRIDGKYNASCQHFGKIDVKLGFRKGKKKEEKKDKFRRKW